LQNTYKKNGPSGPTWSRGGTGGFVRTNRTPLGYGPGHTLTLLLCGASFKIELSCFLWQNYQRRTNFAIAYNVLYGRGVHCMV